MICSSAMEAVSWSRPAQELALPEDELHIWLAWLDVEAQERTRLRSYLNKDEVSRAERFVFPRDRDHFIVARGQTARTARKIPALPAGCCAIQNGALWKAFVTR